MGALDNYFGPQPFMGGGMFGGHPVIGGDELAAAMPIAFAVARQRRAAQAQRCAPQMGWDGQDIMGWGGGGTDMGAVEAEEVAAAMEEDDEDDDDDVLGASTERLEDKLDKWQDKRKKRLSKMRNAKSNLGRKMWANKVEKADEKIAELKREIKQRKAQDRAAAGGGDGRGGGRGDGRGDGNNGRDGRDVRGGGALAQSLVTDAAGRYRGIQRGGVLTPIPLYTGGEIEGDATFGGTGGQVAKSTVPFSFVMNQITYADFRLKGFKIGASLNAGAILSSALAPFTVTTLPLNFSFKIVVQSLLVDGFPNALYGDQTIELGGQFGLSSSKEVIGGIRDNGRINRNNVVRLEGYIMNSSELLATQQAIVSLTAEALVDTESDDVYGSYPLGER